MLAPSQAEQRLDVRRLGVLVHARLGVDLEHDRSVGHEARELMRTDDLNMIHGLVAQGLGLALTTEMAADFRFDVALRPAVQNLGERRVSYATRTGPQPPAVTQLGALLARITTASPT